jgi:drug/metabolite transporter (DMT)-like permease
MLPPSLLLAIPPLLWAGNFVVGRAMHADIGPAALTFWRWACAALVLLPLAAPALRRDWRAAAGAWRLIAVLAATGVFGFQYVVYRGLATTTAINGVLIIASVPCVIPLIAYVLDGSRIGYRHALGVAVSLIGVAVIVLKGNLAAMASLAVTPGDLWMALAALLWSLYSVLVRRRPAVLPPVVLLFACVIVGLAMTAPLYAWESAHGSALVLSVDTVLAIAYVGVFASAVAFLCWNRGVALVGASVAGLYLHLMPVFAAILAMLFLDERPAPYHGVGLVMIGIGLFLATTAGGGTVKPR